MASNQDAEDRLKAALADRYTIEREIGSGGMATVYLAEDVKHNRKVAVKVLDPELAAAVGAVRFLREIETVANLTHPHILPLHDSGEADGFLYYVMPFVVGGSLRDRLEREQQLPVEDAVQIAREIADALAYAHEAGVIHRDVKPANILFEAGHAVLADFGVAQAVAEADHARLTRTGVSLGSPAYMSPEQASGQEDLDGRSDQYALGCVLYEMLAGQPPFTGAQVETVVRQHLTEEPPTVTQARPAAGGEIDQVIRKALAKSPADRFRTTGEMAAALASTTEHTHKEPAPTSNRPAMVLGMLLLVVIAGWALAVLWGGEESSDARGRVVSAPSEEDRPGIAVLPCANISGDPEDVYFTDGIHDEIITQLHKISGLSVISRTSVMEYRDVGRSMGEIAGELGVGTVLECTVRRGGGRVRVTGQLIDARTDVHLWADTYDREYVVESILDIQTDVARAIAGALHAALTPEEERELQRIPTDNLEAYDFYIRGTVYWEAASRQGFTEQDHRSTVLMFERAAELDPDFALAHAWVARVHLAMVYMGFGNREEHMRLAREAVDRALQLSPDLPWTRFVLGLHHYWLAENEAALREFAAAERGIPGNTALLHHKALTLWRLERWDEAILTDHRAVALNPRVPLPFRGLGRRLMLLRRYEEAEEYLNRALELRPDNESARLDSAALFWRRDGNPEPRRRWAANPRLAHEPWVGSLRWLANFAARDYGAALDVLRTMDVEFERWRPSFPKPLLEGITHRFAGEPDSARVAFGTARVALEGRAREQADDPIVRRALGVAYASLGMAEEAIREGALVAELTPGFQFSDLDPGFDHWGLAWIHVLLGNHDRAVEQLDSLLAYPVGSSVAEIRADPWFDDLHDNPRFQTLLERYASEGERN